MISVIIPVYNVTAYLNKCLCSVLGNTYRDLEVICVNDGSTDQSLSILQKWAGRDSRVVIFSQENLGLPEARNRGLQAAHGDYISFIDSDDWVHPRYFESLLNCMEENGSDMVISGCQKFQTGENISVDPNLKPSFRALNDREFYQSYYARHMVWGRLIRMRDAKELHFPPEVDALQDTLYNLRIISGLKNPIVYETDAPLYYYLQRPGSLVHSRPYTAAIQISDWYVKNGRDPQHERIGKWAWTLLLQSITMALSCRYSARLWKHQEVIRYTNGLLRVMLSDLWKDSYVSLESKLSRTVAFLFPCLYRRFRLHKDPSLRDYERSIREQRRALPKETQS